MAKIFATVRLAPGEISYYDQVSGIQLNLNNPIMQISKDMNHSKIRQAIANGKLELVTGTLSHCN